MMITLVVFALGLIVVTIGYHIGRQDGFVDGYLEGARSERIRLDRGRQERENAQHFTDLFSN